MSDADRQFWTIVANAVVTIVTVVAGAVGLWIKYKSALTSSHDEIKKDVQANTDLTAKIGLVAVQSAEARGLAGNPVVEDLKSTVNALNGIGKPC